MSFRVSTLRNLAKECIFVCKPELSLVHCDDDMSAGRPNSGGGGGGTGEGREGRGWPSGGAGFRGGVQSACICACTVEGLIILNGRVKRLV